MRSTVLAIVSGVFVVALFAAPAVPVVGEVPPASAMRPTREIVKQGYRARIDLADQVLSLAIPEPESQSREDSSPAVGDLVSIQVEGAEFKRDGKVIARLAKRRVLAVTEVRGSRVLASAKVRRKVASGWIETEDLTVVGHEDPVEPTLGGILVGRFVSHSVLAQKAKQFDDGLYAAVELAAQEGAGEFAGKSALIASVGRKLAASGNESGGKAAAVVLAAARLGSVEVDAAAASGEPVEDAIATFLADELRSKPISFYTWNDRLRAIFQQDRMLQTKLEAKPDVEALAEAIGADAESRKTYEQYLTLVSGLTNPLASADLRPFLATGAGGQLQSPAGPVHFFPPSVSHETELVKRLFGDQPVPDGFSLIDELISRIRSGRIDLTPTEASGWYDYQTWSQEPMVRPDKMAEAKHLELNDRYRDQLLELFKGVLALTRETHIKQLEIPAPPMSAPARDGGPPEPKIDIYISPELSAEPLVTFYLRRAVGYRFVRAVLEEAFGAKGLTGMHRLTAAGPMAKNLDDELREMEALFHGAYLTVSHQLGMPPGGEAQVGSGKGADYDAARFLGWTQRVRSDPDVGRDVRMMVPTFYDRQRKMTKVWVVLGWQPQQVDISFARRPQVRVLDPQGKPAGEDRVVLHFLSVTETLAYPVTAEVYVKDILDRDEFRRHCDRYKTRSAILAALQ